MVTKLTSLLSLICIVPLGAPLPGRAETLTWKIQSEYEYSVDVEFYARDRAHVWPGHGKVWTLRDDAVHTFTLGCISGEWVCYGAWSRGNGHKYWGVGKDRVGSCDDCCYRCDGGHTDLRTLTP